MKKMSGKSLDLLEKNIDIIQKTFPEVVTEEEFNGKVERKIDFDKLRLLLGDDVSDREERYELRWNGKNDAIRFAQTPSSGTLRPYKESSKNWNDTENLYIEGDNLEVLKLLQKSYFGKIDVIYIDPPYNTGGDFVYKDNFKESIKNYFNQSGQLTRTNTESNGRYHTDWLNMMYPRLKLAFNLLSKNGTVFISIDYHEDFNLRSIMDEIFGANLFVGEIFWESKTKSQNTTTSFNQLQPKMETILVYSKQDKKRFNLISNGEKEYPFVDKKGVYREAELEMMNSKGIRGRKTMVYDISHNGKTVSLPDGKQWKIGKDSVNDYIEKDDLFIRENKVFIKKRPTDEKSSKFNPFWGFFDKEIGTAESGKKELNKLVGRHGFETVKPVEVIKRLIYHASEKMM